MVPACRSVPSVTGASVRAGTGLRCRRSPSRSPIGRTRPGGGPGTIARHLYHAAHGHVDVAGGSVPVGHRPPRAAPPRPADLGHRPVQLPLHLLHAEGGLRPGLRVPAPGPGPDASRRSTGWPGRSSRGRGEAPDHRWRAARPARPAGPDRDAGRAAYAGRLARRPDPDDERLRPPSARAGPPGGRAPAGDGQPRLARRGDVPGDERGRVPGGERPRRDRRRARRSGFGPIKVNMVVRRGINEAIDRADGALGPGGGPHPPLHRVHGRRPLERLAARRGRPGRRGDRDDLGRDAPERRCRRTTRGRSPTAGATSTAAARSGSSPRSPRRSAGPAPGPGSRPTASSTRACSRRGAPTCGRSSGARRPTPSCGPRSGRSGRSGPTATPSSARRRRPTCRGSRCSRSAGTPGDPTSPGRAQSRRLVHRPSTRPRNWWTRPGPVADEVRGQAR